MYVVNVTVFVKPDQLQPFIDATLANARGSRHEPGNVRFDILQDESDPTRFLLHEAYTSKEAFQSHQTTPHYTTWKSTVADMMAQPRSSTKSTALFFGDAPVTK